MPQIVLSTGRREEFVEITGQVQQLVDDAGLGEGLVHLMSLHTTAGLTINENADPDVRSDMLIALEAIAPQRREFRHSEGNSPAHVKASLMGLGLTVPVSAGAPGARSLAGDLLLRVRRAAPGTHGPGQFFALRSVKLFP